MTSELRTSDTLFIRCAEQIQASGDNLVSSLTEYIEAGGDPHRIAQALELFVRAVVADEARAMLEKHRHG